MFSDLCTGADLRRLHARIDRSAEREVRFSGVTRRAVRNLSPPSRGRRRGTDPSRRASRPASHRCEPLRRQAGEGVRTWSEWTSGWRPHIHGSLVPNSQGAAPCSVQPLTEGVQLGLKSLDEFPANVGELVAVVAMLITDEVLARGQLGILLRSLHLCSSFDRLITSTKACLRLYR